MDISALTIKLIILLVPGILAAKIYQRLTVRHKERSDFMFVLIAIMFGVFSYSLLQLIEVLLICFSNVLSPSCKREVKVLEAFDDISDSTKIPWLEVLLGSLLSILIAFFSVKVDHYKWLNWIAVKLRISNKYGDENLYSRWLNDKDIDWVYVRDYKNDLLYWGCVCSFSETEEFKELVLKEVSVFSNAEAKKMYKVDQIYLCLPKDEVKIEKAIDNN